MPTQVGGDHAHRLPKKAQLVEPLHRIPAIPMYKEQRTCGTRRVYVDDADAALSLLLLRIRHIDATTIEFNIQGHTLPLFRRGDALEYLLQRFAFLIGQWL